jgi:hypothetical protein
MVGFTRWYRSTGAAAIGAVIVDRGTRSHFSRPLEGTVDEKDGGRFGPRALNDQSRS